MSSEASTSGEGATPGGGRGRGGRGASAQGVSSIDMINALIAADRAYGAQKYAPACDGYRHALQAGGPSWPGFNRAAESYMFASSQADSNESSLLVADQVWPHVEGTVSSAVVAGTGYTGEDGVEIHFAQCNAAARSGAAGNGFEPAREGVRISPAVGFDIADDDVAPVPKGLLAGLEHGVGFSDAG